MKKTSYIFLFLLISIGSLHAQDTDRKIQFPDLDNFLTLKTDLHIHTVFSDGKVWPNIRVDEAIEDGLDAISLTEHLEYQPHSEDIPHPDRNRSYEIALATAKPHDLIVIHGAEITRSMPPGHSNAIFIKDANKLMIKDSIEVFEEAARQGAFVFWNHPDWIQQRSDGIARMTPTHEYLIENNLLHGIEVVNDQTYSPEALDLAIKHGMIPIGTSDVHGLVDYSYRLLEGGHRPVTLVFAKEKSEESIKASLFAGRVVSWYNNLLVGSEEWLLPLIKASLKFDYKGYIGPSSVLQVEISNVSDASFILKNKGSFTFQTDSDIITIEPHSQKMLLIRTLDDLERVELQFEILNASSGKDRHPTLKLTIGKPQ